MLPKAMEKHSRLIEIAHIRWLLLGALLLGGLRIACFFLLRGEGLAGYELIGTAVGASELSARGILSGAASLWERSGNFQWWNVSHSFLFTFFPGILENLFAWELWPCVWVAVVSVLALLLTSRGLGVSFLVLGAALSASLSFPSYFVIGYPYISGFFPYAAALVAILRFRSVPIAPRIFVVEILAVLAIHELSFHCYEMGKTFGVVFLAAGVLLESVPSARRFIWCTLGAFSLFHVGSIGGNNFGYVAAFGAKDLTRIPEALLSVAHSLFISMDADWPLLLIFASVLSYFLRKDRAFWAMLIAVQLGLLTVGAMQSGTNLFPMGYLVPRRMLLLSFLCALIVATWWKQADGRRSRDIAASLLALMGVGASLHSLHWWNENRVVTTLPYVSPKIDFRIDRSLIADVSQILFDLRRDSTLERVFLYDFNLQSENMGDPQALPERLLLSLGVETFQEKIRFLMTRKCRFWCLPEEVARTPSVWAEQTLRQGSDFVLYVHNDRLDSPYLSMLELRASVVPVESPLAYFSKYLVRVTPHAADSTPVVFPSTSDSVASQGGGASEFCVKAAPRLEYEDFYRRAVRGELYGTILSSSGNGVTGRAISQWIWTFLTVSGTGPQRAHLELEGGAEVQLLLDYTPIFFTTPGPGGSITKGIDLDLMPGVYRLDMLTTLYEETRPKLSIVSKASVHASCTLGTVQVDEIGALESKVVNPELCVRGVTDSGAPMESAVRSGLPLMLGSRKPEQYEVFGEIVLEKDENKRGLVLFDALAEDTSHLEIGGESVWTLANSLRQQRALGAVAVSAGATPIRFQFNNTLGMGLLRLDLILPSGESAPVRCLE